MIYCPTCKKPSVKNEGLCPHCGGDLSPGKKTEETKSRTTRDTARKPDGAGAATLKDGEKTGEAESLTGEREIDFGNVTDESPTFELDTSYSHIDAGSQNLSSRGGGTVQGMEQIKPPQNTANALAGKNSQIQQSGIALSSLAPPEKTPSRKSDKLPDTSKMEIEKKASFGTVEAGFLGSVKYFIKVRKRINELNDELAISNETLNKSAHNCRKKCAKLGMISFEQDISDSDFKKIARKAVKLGKKLDKSQSNRLDMEAKQQDIIENFTDQIKKFEKESKPHREMLKELNSEMSGLVTEKNRISASVSRTQIELRNIDNMITRNESAAASGKAGDNEKQTAMQNLSDLESKRPTLEQNIREKNQELDIAKKPIEKLGEKIEAVSTKVREYELRIEDVEYKLDIAKKISMEKQSKFSDQMEEESKEVETVWANAGKRIMKIKSSNPEIVAMIKDVQKAGSDHDENQSAVELITRARKSYNEDAFNNGRLILVAGGITAAGLLIILSLFVL